MIGTSRSGISLFTHIFIHQPEDSLWHLAVRGKQDDRQIGKPLLNMAGYGFYVHAFMFVLQQTTVRRRSIAEVSEP